MLVEHITCEGGDWEVLVVNGTEFYSGHSVPADQWKQLLRATGVRVINKEISDEDMEKGEYNDW